MIWTGSFRRRRQVHWLYSLLAIILAGIAVIVLLTMTSNRAGRFVKDWQYITDAYIDRQALTTGEHGVVRKVILASKPQNFKEELDLLTFGEGTHFGVNAQPGMESDEIITQVSIANDPSMGKRRLPYPPQSLRCVYLDYAEKQDVVIFLGYHTDMYSAEWVAHMGEQAPFSAAFIDLLVQLDCEFTLLP